jgi:PPOX class probable F420-dependent enzyme
MGTTGTDTTKERRMAQLTDDQRQFLDNPYLAVVTTIRKDGSPHNTVVWIDVEDGVPSFNTAQGRAKPKHLEQNPWAAVTVLDPQNPYKWLAVDGRAEITTDDADDQIDRLSEKYTGNPEYQNRVEGEQRLKVRINPEHVTAVGF